MSINMNIENNAIRGGIPIKECIFVPLCILMFQIYQRDKRLRPNT
jgi:hypothetical protein